MREEANVRAIAELKPDYMGFIFYAASKRFVDQADADLLKNLPHGIKSTGVFVDEDLTVVLQKAKQYRLKAIQLHGSETPEYCESLKKELNGIELIKAFGIDENFDFTTLDFYKAKVDFFLFDTKTPAHGGSGLKFNWKILANYSSDKLYFLSGGIGLEDLNEITAIKDRRLYAVDLNSRFETSPGLKKVEQVNHAINVLRETSELKID